MPSDPLLCAEVEDNRPADWPANAYSITVTPAVEGETEQGDDFECAPLLLLCCDFACACLCAVFLTASGGAVRLELLFAYPHTYPDEPPLYKARRCGSFRPSEPTCPVFKMCYAACAACSVRGLSDSELQDLASKLDEQVEANIGMVHAYSSGNGCTLCGLEAQA